MKYCKKCNKEKPLEEFGIDRSEKDGHRYSCKNCLNKRQREYANNNKEVIKLRNKAKSEKRRLYYNSQKGVESSRRAHLKRKFNLTLEDYKLLSEKQGDVCAICGSPEMNNKNKVLCVDHCHNTGKIRGLLCGKCNAGIGHFMDDIKIIEKSIKYLELWK